MKLTITEKQTSIEGKGDGRTLFALLTKGIEGVLLAVIQAGELNYSQAVSMVLDCAYCAKEEVYEILRGKENG